MVPVANKPMIDYNLELLRNAGIKEGKIVIITKYLQDEIRNYFNTIEHFNDLEIILPKVDPLDTADAVRKAANYIDTDNFIVSMADIITNLPLNDFMSFHREKGGIASITLKDVSQPRAYGVIMLNQDSRILLFLEKPHPEELSLATLTFSLKETIRLQSNLVNTGIYAFKKKVLDILERLNDLMDFGKHVFPYLAREYGIFGYARRDYYWIDAGNPQTYLYTNWDVLRRWSYPYFPKATWEENNIWFDGSKPVLNSGSRIKGPAAIGSDVQINENVYINPLSVIGNNVIIGKNSVIYASIIWSDVVIGANVKINSSIICNNAIIPSNSKLAPGTVIGPNTRFDTPIITSENEIVKEN
jgi:NDP-sugar pyrophosphorylase family protein